MYGDLAGMVLALLALVAVQRAWSVWRPLTWLFVAETAVDLSNALVVGLREELFASAQNLSWVILTFCVPLLWVTLALIVWALVAVPQPERHACSCPSGGARWDNPTMIVTLDAKRRLTVPTSLAPTAPGDYFDAHFDAEEDALVFRRLAWLAGKEDWLAVLKACPVSPDDVPPRRRAPARRRKL